MRHEKCFLFTWKWCFVLKQRICACQQNKSFADLKWDNECETQLPHTAKKIETLGVINHSQQNPKFQNLSSKRGALDIKISDIQDPPLNYALLQNVNIYIIYLAVYPSRTPTPSDGGEEFNDRLYRRYICTAMHGAEVHRGTILHSIADGSSQPSLIVIYRFYSQHHQGRHALI